MPLVRANSAPVQDSLCFVLPAVCVAVLRAGLPVALHLLLDLCFCLQPVHAPFICLHVQQGLSNRGASAQKSVGPCCA